MPQFYSQEEAEAILTKAVGRQPGGTVSHEQLLAMAEELGITPQEVEAVLGEAREAEDGAKLRLEFIGMRRATFWPHLIPYLLVNFMLLFINMKSGGFPWVLFPLLGWGIGLACHAVAVLPTRGPEFEHQFGEWKSAKLKREQRRERRSTAKASKATAEPQTEAAVSNETVTEAASQPAPQTIVTTAALPEQEQAVLRQGNSG
jgi:hypothetical protein